MKNISRSLGLAAGLLLLLAALAMAGPGDILFLQGNRVNVRTGPGPAFPVTAQLDRGAEVAATGRQDGWIAVNQPATGLAGWINAEFLSRNQPVAGHGRIKIKPLEQSRPPVPPALPAQPAPKSGAADRDPGLPADQKISIKLIKAPLADFFAAISAASGVEFMVSPAVKTPISMRFTEASMQDALALVLELYGLTLEKRAGGYFVQPVALPAPAAAANNLNP